MNKKIVIIPCFGEGHFTKYQIENLIDTINPDVIIYNEGLFPLGPENKGGVNEDFVKEFCYNDTNLAWDTELVQNAVKDAQEKYPDKVIKWNHITYENITDANECYVYAVSNFKSLGIDVNPGDLIFPLEGDVFFHENDMPILNDYINNLNNDSGLQAPYLDFLENQFYVEADSLDESRIHKRRIVIKYGTMEYYKNIVKNFTSQKYPELILVPIYIFHYAWWRPGKYKELRFKQLIRPEYYSNAFRNALNLAKENILDTIVIRPDRHEQDPLRYIVKIDINHPKHIKKHLCWI